MKIKKYATGSKMLFTYPDYGTPDTHPDYKAHSGQVVTIIGKLSKRGCEPPNVMYRVEAADGWNGDVHQDELSRNTPFMPKGKYEATLRNIVSGLRGYRLWKGRTSTERELICAIQLSVGLAANALKVNDPDSVKFP